MITVYQMLKQGVDIDVAMLFTRAATSSTRGHQLKLLKPQAVSRVRRNAFSVRVISEWNALPPSVVTAPNVNVFKARLDRHWVQDRYNIHIND